MILDCFEKENVTSSTEASQMRLKSVEELKAKKEKELVEELRSVEKRRKQLQLVLAHIKERSFSDEYFSQELFL